MSWLTGNDDTGFLSDLGSLYTNATTGNTSAAQKADILSAAQDNVVVASGVGQEGSYTVNYDGLEKDLTSLNSNLDAINKLNDTGCTPGNIYLGPSLGCKTWSQLLSYAVWGGLFIAALAALAYGSQAVGAFRRHE